MTTQFMYGLDVFHILLVAIGAAIVLAHWLPRFVSGREPASSALLIGFGWLAFGWIPGLPQTIGPLALPGAWEKVSEFCVIAGLFGVGLRIDQLGPWAKWQPTVRLLLVTMPLCILAITLGGMLAGMTLAGAILLGAVLAPTDPVLASDVQVGPPTEGGEHPVRFTLTTEAGLNDGLAFPFVHLGLAIAAVGVVSSDLLIHWLWLDVAYRIAVGAASGLAVGWVLGKILFAWPSKNSLANTSAGIVALAGVLLTYGVTELVEGYGFIAVFVAAVTLRRIESRHQFHGVLHNFVEAIERSLTSVLLVGLGAAMSLLLSHLDWAGAALALGLILVIRPLAGWLALGGTVAEARARGVIGFYGIRGIGSVYYLGYAASHIDLINVEQLWAIVAFAILVSTIVHGFTAGLAVARATGEEEEDTGVTSAKAGAG